jgi:diguanylate cyclase (GGDEF)-like protein
MAVGIVLAVVSIGTLAYLLVLNAGGARLVRVHHIHHVPTLPFTYTVTTTYATTVWLILALAAAVLGLLAWALAERRLAGLSGVQSERERERADTERMTQAWRREREWNQELRGQIAEMQRAQGVLGRHDDVRKMVLELTMGLVDAEKGLLLSDQEGADQQLEVVCFSGFEADPHDSAIAQRFGKEVIERDKTIREDDSAQVNAQKHSAADDEVFNLLAIPIYLSDDFAGVIVCANREGGFEELDDDVLLAIGDHAGAVLQNSRLHGDLRTAYLSTIRVLANAIELKDPELRGHSNSVSDYVLAVSDRLNLDPQEREGLIFASLLHDVGKLGISERILLKPAGLTPEERSVIQMHPRIGYDLITQVPALQEIAPAVLHHHERYDGEGYPERLRGETIPLASRIIAIADSFSAMTSDRPYSRARSVEDACAELERCAGGQFDPEVVRLFVEEVRRRPPATLAADAEAPDPELEAHRALGDYKLGSRSFSITDSLTLLYSHRHFHETAAAEAQRARVQSRPFSVVIVHLEGMDKLNAAHGFDRGDLVLRATATIVQQAATRLGGQAYRVSGRRIGLLAPDADSALTEQTATALALELEPVLSANAVAMTVGTGVWTLGEGSEDVIARAMAAGGTTQVGAIPMTPTDLV